MSREQRKGDHPRSGPSRSEGAIWASAVMIFRALTVATAMLTVLLTWPVWQIHTTPPQLPLLPLPNFPIGGALLVVLAACLVAPTTGFATYAAVFLYAVLVDQTRLQPQFLTFGFFLWATLPGTTGLTLARVYLITLWFYAGLHKLLSVDFMTQSNPWMMHALAGSPPEFLRVVFPWAIACGELGLAIFAVIRRTRGLAVVGAFLLHGTILISLVRAGWNPSVWPWNVLCAVAGLFLILRWKTSLGADLRASNWQTRAAATWILLYPLGFYAGVVDAYTSHSLYAMNQPRGFVCPLSGEVQAKRPGLGDEFEYLHRDGPFHCRAIYTSEDLGTPLPPLHRLFEDYFQKTCAPGEFLLIQERRRWTDPSRTQRIFFCGAPSEVTNE